jgi:putative transcriptional regulator
MDYFHSKQKFSASCGDLLISEPYLGDPNFERTVIFLCEHNEKGSFGYVINKPSENLFDEVIEGVDSYNETLFIGGPVEQNTLHFLHRAPQQMNSGKVIKEDIHWSGSYDTLLSLINDQTINRKDYKFFIGYSGWSEGQLEAELEAKSWMVYKRTSSEHIFDINHKELWQQVLKNLGGKFKMFSNYPVDPNMN